MDERVIDELLRVTAAGKATDGTESGKALGLAGQRERAIEGTLQASMMQVIYLIRVEIFDLVTVREFFEQLIDLVSPDGRIGL